MPSSATSGRLRRKPSARTAAPPIAQAVVRATTIANATLGFPHVIALADPSDVTATAAPTLNANGTHQRNAKRTMHRLSVLRGLPVSRAWDQVPAEPFHHRPVGAA